MQEEEATPHIPVVHGYASVVPHGMHEHDTVPHGGGDGGGVHSPQALQPALRHTPNTWPSPRETGGSNAEPPRSHPLPRTVEIVLALHLPVLVGEGGAPLLAVARRVTRLFEHLPTTTRAQRAERNASGGSPSHQHSAHVKPDLAIGETQADLATVGRLGLLALHLRLGLFDLHL